MRLETFSALSPLRAVLDNGIVCLTKRTSATPAVAINLAMQAGSVLDPAGMPGTVWLLSRVIDRGTATRSATDIAEELDSRGITLTITVTRHLCSLLCSCLADDFEAVLALLADVLIAPSFPEVELATRKGEVITAIRQDADSPAVRATETLMSLLYSDGHPYGRPTKGTIEVVNQLSRDRLRTLHAARFVPSALTAAIVGDVDSTRAIDVTARLLGGWRADSLSAAGLPPVRPASRRQRVVIPMMNKAQADIAYGFTTISRRDPAYYAFWLMNNIFGQYALGGRLGDSIREQQGMAYYVSSSLDANVAPGPLTIRAGVSPANIDRAVASIDEEVRRITGPGVSQEELDDSRQFLIGSIPRALETNAAIANFLQVAEFFGLGLDYDVRLPGLLGGVILDDVNAAARRAMDTNRATVVIAGPYVDPAQRNGV